MRHQLNLTNNDNLSLAALSSTVCPVKVFQRPAFNAGKGLLAFSQHVLAGSGMQLGFGFLQVLDKPDKPLPERCCNKPCHKPQKACPHLCQVACHPGECPAAKACAEEVLPCRLLSME